MPRSRRRAGIPNGKTLRQIHLAERHQKRLDRQEAAIARAKRDADRIRDRLDAASEKFKSSTGPTP